MTVSLVTYKHTLAQVRPVVEAVLKSSCVEKFYVVDNAGESPLRGELAKEFPLIEYIPLPNPGFGAAHNVAIRRAMERGATLHAIVNPDIDFKPGTLETIDAFFAANADVGLVMPKTVNVDGSMQFNCRLLPTPFGLFARRFLPRSWIARRTALYEMHDVDHEKSFDCAYLCGCFMVFRLACLKEVGLFDERFFMYPEDIDISRRVYDSRWRSVYYPTATVVHAHEAASYKSWRMTRVHIWNMIKYFNKWGFLFDRARRRINREVKMNAPRLSSYEREI